MDVHRKVRPSTEQQYSDIETIFAHLNGMEIDEARVKLEKLSEKEKKAVERFDKEGSLLHVAINLHKEGSKKGDMLYEFINDIIEAFPSLLNKSRSDRKYAGQTPLHIAIVQENKDLVMLILKRGKDKFKTKFTEEILHIPAKGTKFKNTVMMGQLPLSVAALSLNKEIVQILMYYKVNIGKQNKHGDTVLHSLVKYAAIHPNKTDRVINMLKFLHVKYIVTKSKPMFFTKENVKGEECERCLKYEESKIGIWFMTNNEHITPLQLAAKLGIEELVAFILDLGDVYFFRSAYDGLFDVKMYDITEIDSVTNQQMEKEIFSDDKMMRAEGMSKMNVDDMENCCTCCGITCRIPLTKSITEMLFTNDYENDDALEMIKIPVVRRIIEEKWKRRFKFLMLWGIAHLALMVFLTAYAVVKADTDELRARNVDAEYFMLIVPVIFGILYLLVVVSVLSSRARRQCFSNYWMKNLQHVLMLFTYAICIFIHLGTKDNYVGDVTLSIAIISGWSFFTFFLSPFKLFCFFTELLKQIILKDFTGFSVIIFFEYLAFSTSMYIMLRLHPESSDDNSELEQHYNLSFGDILLIMFKLLIGLEDIEMIANAKVYWYAITLYIVFVLLTYILLLNALIALMSSTSEAVQTKRYEYRNLQQLSVVLFLEEILPCFQKPIGEAIYVINVDLETNSSIKRQRWFLQMLYLDDTKYDTEEKNMLKVDANEYDGKKYDKKPNGSEENLMKSLQTSKKKNKATQTQIIDVYEQTPDGTSSVRTLIQTIDIQE